MAASWLYEMLVQKFGSGMIFKDVDNIKPGQDFIEKLTSAVISCDVLLAVIGPDWLDTRDEHGARRLDDPNDWVRLEVEIALSRGVCVIPLLVENAKMPRSVDLPHKLVALTRRQAHELSPNHFKRDADLLLPVIEEALTQEAERAERSDGGASTLVQPTQRRSDGGRSALSSTNNAFEERSALDVNVADEPRRGAAASDWDATRSFPPVRLSDAQGSRRPAGKGAGSSTPSRPRRSMVLGGAAFALVVLMLGATLVVPRARSFLRGPEPGPSVTGSAPVSALPKSDQPLAKDIFVWRVHRGKSWDIVTVNRDGATVTVLASGGDKLRGQVISPDRQTVLFRKEGKGKVQTLYAVAADDPESARPLFSTSPACRRLSRPAWIADNRLLMACGGPEEDTETLKVMTYDGEIIGTIDEFAHMGDPTVSPDGKWAVYWRNTAKKHVIGGALYATPLQGNVNPRRLTDGDLGQDAQPAFSPTGDQVLFTRLRGGSRSIQLLEFEGIGSGNFGPLTDGAFNEDDPSWSPDGAQLAFGRSDAKAADKGRDNEASKLFTMSVRGGPPTQVSRGPMVGIQVAWSRR